MMKKTKKNSFSIRPIKKPYFIDELNNDISSIYQRYLDDKESIISKNGLTYFKIIELFEFNSKDANILVLLDSRINLNNGDVLIDENSIEYSFIRFEMIRIFDVNFPDLYKKLHFVALNGDINSIGNYLSKVQMDKSVDKEYDRICKKLGFIPSEYKCDMDEENDNWINPFSVLTIEEQDYLYNNGYLNKKSITN